MKTISRRSLAMIQNKMKAMMKKKRTKNMMMKMMKRGVKLKKLL
jgi:hypothetical protein